MKRMFVWSVLVLVIPSLVACSGGDSTGDVVNNGGGSSTLSASFIPDMSTPLASGTVSLQQGSTSENLVTIDAMVTDVTGVYSAAFDLVFNPAQVEFVGRSAGGMLESGNVSVNYTAQLIGTSRVVVSASRVGAVGGTDADGSERIVRLTFRLTRSGSSAVSIENADLFDVQIQSTAGVTWSAGSVSATD